MSSTPDVVFLVEDFNINKDGRMTYWAKVYVSEAKARAGVEYWAAAQKKGPLTWTESHAYWDDNSHAYAVVPLAVFQDSDVEAPRSMR